MKILNTLTFTFFLAHSAVGQINVLTQHNNLGRTGWNKRETILTTKNVSKNTFGIIFTRPVDDQVYAQPLVVSNITINNASHNVVYVATVNNTLYAFDADLTNVSTPYWQKNLTPAGTRAVKNTDMTGACGGSYTDFSGNMGIVGTPVIDTVSQTLFVVARNVTGTTYQQFLHAVDIRTGSEKAGSPILISAQANGNGDGSVSGVINFHSQKQNQRPGLLLLNGTVYIGFASHCDWDPYHGWLLGYNANTLQQTVVYNTTPAGREAGIWMSGAGPSADEFGNIYLATGNGSVGTTGNESNPINRGESALKLTLSGNSLSVASFFTPSNYAKLETNDLDFGVTAMLLIPNSNWVVSGSKDGYLFLMDRNNLGGFNASTNNVKQTIDLGRNKFLRSSLSYYKGSTKEFLYTWSENASLTALPFNRITNTFDIPNLTTSSALGPIGNNGALLSVSSNGSIDSTAILWASHASGDAIHNVRPGIIRAFDATNVTRELWNSSMDASDPPGFYAKFVNPTIANGKLYMATFSNKLVVYGLINKLTTGIDKTKGDGDPQIYPNPAPEIVTVRKGKEDIIEISLYDLSGRLLKNVENIDHQTEIHLPLTEAAKGLYLLQVKSLNGTYRFKILH